MIRALSVSMLLLMLVGAASSEAQSQQSSDQSSAAGTSGSAAVAKPKPRKVWTNDDMSEVTGTISVVGTPQQKQPITPSKISSLQPAGPAKTSAAKTPDPKTKSDSVDPKALAQLREQLQKLQAGIDQLDRQITQLKDASHGNSKNMGVLTSDPSQYSMEPVPDQIKALEAKKASLQAAMDQLLDAARASGIEPGQLR